MAPQSQFIRPPSNISSINPLILTSTYCFGAIDRSSFYHKLLENMKILLIAGYFPPYAPVSATRVNKLAKYWHDLGHEVRVLAPRNAGFPPVMQPEIPAEQVIFTPIFEVIEVPGRIKTKVKAWLGRNTEKTPEAKAAVPPDTAAANTLKGPS